jgi:hypothetical protein
MAKDIEIIKKGYSKDRFNLNQIEELRKCMSDPIYFCKNYVKIQHPTQGRVPFKLWPYQEEMIDSFHKNRYTIALTARQMGKALSLDTPILTPSGFTTMGELKIGDEIYGADGETTRIQFITETMYDRPCYLIEFSHGDSVIADAEHLWTVVIPTKKPKTVTITTLELLEEFRQWNDTSHSIHIKHCEAIKFKDSQLPVNPYLLGLWLGDGGRNSSGITCHIDDFPTYQREIEKAGFRSSKFRLDKRSDTTGSFNIAGGFKIALRQMGVLSNKHIPDYYIFTSVENRLELLRGLMDTDGSVEKNGTCNFYQSDETMVRQVRLLLSSLGIKSTISSRETGHKVAWSLRFTTSAFDIFKLERKLERQKLCKSHPKNTRIYIKSIEPTDSVPVRCLQVDNDDHLFLCGETLVPTHNTTCAAGFLLWKAMFEPDTTILIAANKFVSALEIMDRIRFAYENLEQYNWLRSGVVEYNKGTISFDNGSRIISRATSKDAGRGLSISLLYLDEFAFVQPNKAVEFWSAIAPTLSTGGSCIITSTPNNDEDQFAEIWFGAKNNIDDNGEVIPGGVGRNGYKPLEITWDKNPTRDEAWAQTQRQQLGEEKFQREYECKFVSEDETLINPITLANLSPQEPIFKIGSMRWFEEPKPNHIYGATLDPSMGTGSDFSAIQVFDLTTLTQVAEWRHNKTITQDQVEILRKALLYIHHSLVNHPDQDGDPEIYWTVENNSLGEAALVYIDTIGEENFPGIFTHEPRKTGGGKGRKGLNTNSRTKMTACARFKTLVETRRMTLKSRALLTELKNFVRGGGSYKGKIGVNDDLVMGTLQIVRLLQICADWEEQIEENLKSTGDMDDTSSAPMPMSF